MLVPHIRMDILHHLARRTGSCPTRFSLAEEKQARAEEADRVSRMKAVLQDLLSQLVNAKYELFTNGSYMEDISVRCF